MPHWLSLSLSLRSVQALGAGLTLADGLTLGAGGLNHHGRLLLSLLLHLPLSLGRKVLHLHVGHHLIHPDLIPRDDGVHFKAAGNAHIVNEPFK